MTGLGRSFKPPAYLRARRPVMPGRALSNSSDISVTSTGSRSDDHYDLLMSGLNTPTHEKPGMDGPKMPAHSELSFTKGETSAPCQLDLSTLQSARYNRSRPVAIDLPPAAIRKINSAPACTPTPPEPLSARGDVPGGYFPFHEDSKNRVNRSYPFQPQNEVGHSRHQSLSLAVDSSSRADQRGTSLSAAMTPTVRLSPLSAIGPSDFSNVNTPVASYLPSGVHDSPLPMGKYYPSNYEQQNGHGARTGSSGPPSRSSTRSEGHIPTREAFRTSSRQDSDARRKLQQYQRDMIAQARLAASEVLGSSPNQGNAAPSSTITLNGIPLTNVHHIGTTGVHKPVSPRLLPLGSPGPVTPMDLEGGQSGYIDWGCNDEIARVLRAEEKQMRREGPTPPAVGTGPQAF
ncbi:hypothetical protein CSUB01_10637 [Colletotrichum sublineola]|uniref:Uncharacterized protein n=1 Tax=Colletotrichum sublineola TaxID=1173701 RepID=A0A066XVS9_COLSU|nr:hypothetical protein CSUB01_10637 [Colletotrichum sublineola]